MPSSEKAPSIFVLLFPLSKYLFFSLSPSISIGKKRPFNKAFNIDYWLLVDNHVGEDANLSFIYCKLFWSVNFNTIWQRELLDQKTFCMLEVILLFIAVFWYPIFVFCLRHIFNFIKKLGLKAKNSQKKIYIKNFYLYNNSVVRQTF